MKKMEYINEIVSWEEEFEFFYQVKVRFSETDMFGHLNNTVPFTYFEQARIEDLKIYVKANSIGNSSVDLHYMVKKADGSICLTGRGTIVQISKRTGKGVSWTEEMRQLFSESKKSAVK